MTLNNGVEMPALGLGVFQSPPEETVDAVEAAIASGYRLVDTAAAYGNEREVGEGIRRSGIDRREIFIVGRVWMGIGRRRPTCGRRPRRQATARATRGGCAFVDSRGVCGRTLARPSRSAARRLLAD